MKKVKIKVFLKTSTNCSSQEITDSARIDVDGADFEVGNKVAYKNPYNQTETMGLIVQLDQFLDENILYIVIYVR